VPGELINGWGDEPDVGLTFGLLAPPPPPQDASIKVIIGITKLLFITK
jgi:hypothetical protein